MVYPSTFLLDMVNKNIDCSFYNARHSFRSYEKNEGKCKYIIVHVHATKTHRGSTGIGPGMLNFSTGQMSSGKLQFTTALPLVSSD